MGTKRSILTDQREIPLSVVLDGVNRHDVKLLEKILDSIVILRPEVTQDNPQNLCLNAGYTGSEELVEKTALYCPYSTSLIREERKREKP